MTEAANKVTELTVLLSEVVDQATFDVLGRGIFSATKLREMHCQSTGLDKAVLISSAQPQVKKDLMRKLTQQLRSILGQYIANDGIGNGFAFIGGTIHITVTDFALELVRAAAILGPVQVTQIVYEWAKGDPVPYRTCVVLSGISVDQPLEIDRGIRFIGLPNSSLELSAHLPWHVTPGVETSTLLRAVKATIDCRARPALYRFDRYDPKIVECTWAYGAFSSDLSLDALCEALSLACDSHVSWRVYWFECDSINEFNALGGYLGGRPRTFDIFSHSSTKKMSQQHLEYARTVLDKRLAKENAGRRRDLDLAIRRWMGSKGSKDFADQLIELRIALEALYLPGTRNEIRFHLATRGAWHLGADFNERRKYQEILRDVYDLGSKAVHASGVKSSNQDRKLLAEAQDLCRKGILKRLDEAGEPNWNELILGKELEANS